MEKNRSSFLRIEHFIRLKKTAEEGSISAAAEKLGITQPALSMSLKSLERYLDVKILMHNGRNVKLTRAGRELLEIGDEIISKYSECDNLKYRFPDSMNRNNK